MFNKREIGNKYEDIATSYLVKLGYDILCRNYHFRGGEIDIIAKDGNELVFVEVKYRANCNYDSPLASITYAKINRIRKGASIYINKNTCVFNSIRFDVIGILKEDIEHIKQAF